MTHLPGTAYSMPAGKSPYDPPHPKRRRPRPPGTCARCADVPTPLLDGLKRELARRKSGDGVK